MIAITRRKWMIVWKKMYFADLAMDAVSCSLQVEGHEVT